MLYVSDFFTRNKEAVSIQLELLASHQSGKIVAATRFMKQKALHKNELKDNIFIVPAFLYPAALALALRLSRGPVHIFEEESFLWKKFVFNTSGKPLYVSLYRRPELKHIEQLKGYKHLKKVFVELPVHKDMLIEHGIDGSKIAVSNTPSKVARRITKKVFDPKNVNIVFASWNNSEANALYNRGLVYLIDLLVKNPEYSLTIPLRDSKTDEFWRVAKKKGVADRISLLEIKNQAELEDMFEKSDFVAFVAQDRVVKDVPNSLLDGLAYGKPAIISDVLDFWTVVDKEKIGYVMKAGDAPKRMKVTAKEYDTMSKKAYAYSARHTPAQYQKAATKYEDHHEHSNR